MHTKDELRNELTAFRTMLRYMTAPELFDLAHRIDKDTTELFADRAIKLINRQLCILGYKNYTRLNE